MSVYSKEKAEYLDKAIASMVNQTLKPLEFVIVKDGPLTKELENVLEEYIKKYPGLFKIIGLKENIGLGGALAIGILQCSQEFVARMDSDDIAVSERLERQLYELKKGANLALIGSYITEFNGYSDEKFIRKVPLTHEDIVRYGKRRNPFNHMTVMFRKEAILAAGNYIHFLGFEDYYLWVRMLVKQFKVANLPQSLVLVRAGEAMHMRRGGIKYLINEIELQQKFLQMGFISKTIFISNIFMRLFVRLCPNNIRGFIYKKLLREKM